MSDLKMAMAKMAIMGQNHANRTIPSKVMSDFVNSFEKVLILQYNNGMLAKKLATRFLVLQS